MIAWAELHLMHDHLNFLFQQATATVDKRSI